MASSLLVACADLKFRWGNRPKPGPFMPCHSPRRMETVQDMPFVDDGFSEIEDLTLQVIEHHYRKGGTYFTYAPTLWSKGGARLGFNLADWVGQDESRSVHGLTA